MPPSPVTAGLAFRLVGCCSVLQVLCACHLLSGYESHRSDGAVDGADRRDGLVSDVIVQADADPCLAGFGGAMWICKATVTSVVAKCGSYKIACPAGQGSCDCFRAGRKTGTCFTSSQGSCAPASVAFGCCKSDW